MLMNEHCCAVSQTAFQTLWQSNEGQSVGISHLFLKCAYIRNFLLGWHPIEVAQRYVIFGPEVGNSGLSTRLRIDSDEIGWLNDIVFESPRLSVCDPDVLRGDMLITIKTIPQPKNYRPKPQPAPGLHYSHEGGVAAVRWGLWRNRKYLKTMALCRYSRAFLPRYRRAE